MLTMINWCIKAPALLQHLLELLRSQLQVKTVGYVITATEGGRALSPFLHQGQGRRHWVWVYLNQIALL